jgi:hypothetical protein
MEIAGRVVLDGVPMPHYRVSLSKTPHRHEQQEVRGADGRFTFSGLEPGTWRVEIVGTSTKRVVLEEVIMCEGEVVQAQSYESVHFQHLAPGRYRASIDGTTWTPIVVKPSPQEQIVELGL